MYVNQHYGFFMKTSINQVHFAVKVLYVTRKPIDFTIQVDDYSTAVKTAAKSARPLVRPLIFKSFRRTRPSLLLNIVANPPGCI